MVGARRRRADDYRACGAYHGLCPARSTRTLDVTGRSSRLLPGMRRVAAVAARGDVGASGALCPHARVQFPLKATELIESALSTVQPPTDASSVDSQLGPWHCPNCRNHLEARDGGVFMCNGCGLVIGGVLQLFMQKRVGHTGRDI
jgi:hypothetical protein